MRSSLRGRLLLTFFVLFALIGGVTLYLLEGALAADLVAALDARLTTQAHAIATWFAGPTTPDARGTIARLGEVISARITVVAPDGTIIGDSSEPDLARRPIGDAPEVTAARAGRHGQSMRALDADADEQYMVAVPGARGEVIRVAVPAIEVEGPRSRMRRRLLTGIGFALLASILISWAFVRALGRPLRSMKRSAERLAAGDYDGPPPTDAGGELGFLARALTHLTQEVKARVSELTQQRDLLSVVVGRLVEGVVVVDRAGTVMLVNDVARPLLGDEALPPALEKLVEHAQAGEGVDAELELRGRTVRASARPLSAPALPGQPEATPGSILVLYDITRMRALEAVRREFLSNAAHELRTPVTSISGYAETLLGGTVDTDTSREFLTTIHRNAQRISELVSDLLVLDSLGGRATAIEDRVPIALAQVIGHAVMTAQGVTPNAQLVVEVDAQLAVLGSRDGLEHVIQNLIDNAVKYGGGTPVVISAELEAGKHPLIRLSVRDSGPGIPDGHEERVFERFYRIDPGRSRDRGGSGLGLAIVKSHVEAMGGRVWVEQAQPGARFIVELDAAELTADEPPRV